MEVRGPTRRPAVFGTDRRENASHSPVAATTQACRREWERDDDFRPASRPASQHSTTTQLAALLARPKHPLVVGGDEPFTFLYDYGTQSRLELRVVSAKPKPRISNAALAGAPGTSIAAAALRLLQPEPYPRIAYFDNDAVATGRRIGLDEKYPTFAKAFLDPRVPASDVIDAPHAIVATRESVHAGYIARRSG